MSLDLSAVGYKTDPSRFEYDWKAAVLYALGIGAGPAELDLLYEARGPRVFPTFPIAGAYPVMMQLIERAGASFRNVVHTGQTIRIQRAPKPNGVLTTRGTLSGIYDLKRMARLLFDTITEQDGEAVCTMQWDLLVRDTGGFGGPRPPKAETVGLPKEQAPAFELRQPTTPAQALIYRLSGDLNPLHADPELAHSVGFPQGPILHGLCTLGFIARAVVEATCERDERRLRGISMQFKKPVWPGEFICTTGYCLGPNQLALTATAADRPDQIIGNAWAEILN
ncbi:MAG TPA: MaoC/PaaZ C-terminal domain-containing protein [Polyangiaceae bacterium]|nr:MaoC/PaaZ C-terminal domain-containing protein [Polyangiaceae bacterium]